MRKFRIPYIPYRSLLLSITVLNDINRYSDIISMNALRMKLSRTRSHNSSYSRVAVNFHAWTCVTMLDVAVGHAAT